MRQWEPAGVGVVVRDDEGEVLVSSWPVTFNGTTAEVEALA